MSDHKSNVTFEELDSKRVQQCFFEAHAAFPKLHGHQIIVRKKRIKKTTMQAQPVFGPGFLSRRRRRFFINVNYNPAIDKAIKMEDLPERVLTGWFAHELGHIMDYADRSAFNLLQFGLLYYFSQNFRIGAERKADLHAIDHGFGEHIADTKHYILEKSKLPDSYKKRIDRYYMSPQEVEILLWGEAREECLLDNPVAMPGI